MTNEGTTREHFRSTRELADALPLGIVVVEGRDGRVIYANDRAKALLGRSVAGTRLAERREWFRRADGSRYESEADLPSARALRGERIESEEIQVLRPDGGLRHVEIHADPQRVRSGEVRSVLLGFQDVTRRQRAEDAALLKLAEFQTIMAALPDAYFRVDVSGTILDARSGRMSAWPVERLIGKRLEEAFPTETLLHLQGALQASRQARSLACLEYQTRVGTDLRWYEIRVSPVLTDEFVLIVRDVTEHKAALSELRKSVAEKDVLLREIHHRVKNNLQVVSSMLRMQELQTTSADVRALFKDSQTRIQAMSMIHDRLYQSPSLTEIDFGEHLRELAAMLARLFGGESSGIRMHLEVASVVLNLDLAIPLGLLANELITNALKHAFPQRADGTITIRLTDSAAAVSLTVADDGVGFPPDLDTASSRSLGLRMIKALTNQLRGQLTVERARWNAMTVTVPKQVAPPSTS